jgi:hypothetical protein
MARRQVQQVGGLVPRVEWRVRPDSEAGVLTQASCSRLEGNARLIGNGGSATYSFRILSGMDIALRLTISGEGQVRVRTQAGGLLARAFRGGVQQLNLTTRAPLNPPVQTLQVIVEAQAAHAGAHLRTATGRQRPRRGSRRHRRWRRAAARRACERPAPDHPCYPAQWLPDRRGLQPATGLGDRRGYPAQF